MICSLHPVLAAALVLVAQFTQRALIGPSLIMMESVSEYEQKLKQSRAESCRRGESTPAVSMREEISPFFDLVSRQELDGVYLSYLQSW